MQTNTLLNANRSLFMPDRIATRDHNVEVLHDLGFSKVGNTTVFKSSDYFILSPAVAENTAGGYWFDIREANLKRITSTALLFVRIVPDFFIVEKMSDIQELISPEIMDNRPNSGNVWSIHMEIDLISKKAYVFNVRNPSNKILVSIISKDSIKNSFQSVVSSNI
jgi:hypothetical protein